MQGKFEKNWPKGAIGAAKRQHQPKPCPCKFLKQGLFVRAVSDLLSSLAGYTGGCPSAADRPTEPAFWQLKRVRVYAGTD